MADYIDGFVLPIPKAQISTYQEVAEQVAQIWKEYGASDYREFIGQDLTLEGTRSFLEVTQVKEDEVVVFGWVVFPSKEIRDKANKQVPLDPRMKDLVEPLIHPDRLIFDASRMIYGGFEKLV